MHRWLFSCFIFLWIYGKFYNQCSNRAFLNNKGFYYFDSDCKGYDNDDFSFYKQWKNPNQFL